MVLLRVLRLLARSAYHILLLGLLGHAESVYHSLVVDMLREDRLLLHVLLPLQVRLHGGPSGHAMSCRGQDDI